MLFVKRLHSITSLILLQMALNSHLSKQKSISSVKISRSTKVYMYLAIYLFVGYHFMRAQVSLESLLQTFDIDIQLLSKNLSTYNYIYNRICYLKCHIFKCSNSIERCIAERLLKLVWVNISVNKQ